MDADTISALAALETAERLMARAYAAIREGRAAYAAKIIQQAVDVTTTTTVSLVKDQALSDSIAADARNGVRHAIEQIEAEGRKGLAIPTSGK